MPKLSLVQGTTSKLLQVFISDASSSAGAGMTGLAYNTSGLTAYYYREGAGSSVAITLATMTLGTWSTGGFVEVDATNLPGVYQLGIPNAALVSSAKSVMVMLKGVANMVPVLLEIELTAIDNQTIPTSDPWGISLPGPYGAGTAGKISGDKLKATISSRAAQNSVDTVDDFLDTEVAAIKAKTDNIPASPAAVSDIPSAATIAAAVWDYVVEGSYKAKEFLRLCTATLVGKVSGAATTTVTIRDTADSKNRVVATVDAYGNRSSTTLDAS